jgi:hypothetical protein
MPIINTDGAANVPIICRTGKTFSITATFTNSDASPMVLTGCLFDLIINQGGKRFDLTSDISLGGAPFNVVTLSTLITLPKGTYNYEFNFTKTDKTVIGIQYGTFTVNGI